MKSTFLFKSLRSKKGSLFTLFFSLVITINFLYAIIIAPSYFQTNVNQRAIYQYPFDFQITLQDNLVSEPLLNDTEVQDNIQEIVESEIQVQEIYSVVLHHTAKQPDVRSFLRNTSDAFSWDLFISNESESYTNTFDDCWAIGIDSLLFSNSYYQTLAEELDLNLTPLMQSNGVYISDNINSIYPHLQSNVTFIEFEINSFYPNGSISSYDSVEIANMQLLDTFHYSPLKKSLFFQLLGLNNFETFRPVLILGEKNYILELLKNQIFKNLPNLLCDRSYQITVNRNQLDPSNANDLYNQGDALITRINDLGGIPKDQINCLWLGDVDDFSGQLMIFEAIFLIFSIPLFMYGLFFIKSTYFQYMVSDLNRTGVLISLGMKRKKIYRNFLLEALVLGIFSGLVGILTSVIFSQTILQNLFRQTLNLTIPLSLVEILKGIEPSTYIIGVIIGIVISLVTSFIGTIALNKKSSEELIFLKDSTTYTIFKKNSSRKMRIQAIFIAFALLSFIFGIILNKSITDYREVFSTPYTLLFSIIILISAPLSPFVLFFSFLQFATNWIEKVITIKFTNSFRFFGNWIASFSLLKPMKNIRKSSKVLTLLSLSLGLLLFSISIVETERRVIESKELFLNGNSQYLRIKPQPSSKDLFMSDVKMILTSIQEENEQRSLYEAMNWDIDLYLNDLYLFEQNRTTQVFVSIISNENYLRYMDIPDSWMEGMTPYDALNSLNIANHVLIPANYKQYGYDLGDNLTFSYRSQIGGTENFTLIISGFYKIFPLCSFTSSGGAFSNIIIGENTNLSAAQIWRIHLMFYSKNQNDPINRDAISSFLEVKYPDFELLYDYINRPNIYPDEDFYTFYPTIIDFIELEGYYFVVFIGFALIFQIDLYLRNQIHDFALFKSYGMKNSQILKIVCLESLGFILIALVISFIGLIASTMISVFFNIIEQPLPYFSRNINFLNWKYVIGQLILIGIFLGATVFFTLFHTHKISHPDEIVKELKTI